jgi:hypothetical protein
MTFAHAASLMIAGSSRSSNDGVIVTERVFGVADGVDDDDGSGQRALTRIARLLGRRPRARDLRAVLRAADVGLWCADEPDAGSATITLALWNGYDRLDLAHLGDSRAYLVRDGRVIQLTDDHVLDDTDDGVTRLGQRNIDQLELVSLILRDGDTVMLCTDGMWRALTPRDLVAAGDLAPTAACAALASRVRDDDEDASIVVVAFGPPRIRT